MSALALRATPLSNPEMRHTQLTEFAVRLDWMDHRHVAGASQLLFTRVHMRKYASLLRGRLVALRGYAGLLRKLQELLPELTSRHAMSSGSWSPSGLLEGTSP